MGEPGRLGSCISTKPGGWLRTYMPTAVKINKIYND